jgi:hypothetical protein
LSRIIIAAKEAAAPTSKAMARVIANQVGLLSLKKSMTWIVDIQLTKKYNPTKIEMIDHLIILSVLFI